MATHIDKEPFAMKKFVWIIPLLVVALVIMKGKSRERGRDESPPAADSPLPVKVQPVEAGRLDRTLDVTGSIRVDEDVAIASKIFGKAARVGGREGERVSRGQLLIQLDRGELLAQVRAAEANLKSARARKAQLRASEDMRFTGTNTRIAQARASLDGAKVRVSQMETQAQITETQTRAQSKDAEAALAAAKERLSLTREGARRQEKLQSDLMVAQAKANYENAKSYHARRKQLFESGAVSREMLDEAERQLKVAEAQHRLAQEQSSLVHEGARAQEVRLAEEDVHRAEEMLRQAKSNEKSTKIRQEDIDATKTQVRQAEAELQNAVSGRADVKVLKEEIHGADAAVQQAEAALTLSREQLGNTRIVSPVKGVIVSRSVNVGEMVTPGVPLMTVVSVDTAYFEALVPEVSVGEVEAGMPVSVTIDSAENQQFRGQVRSIIPVASQESRSFRIRVSIPTSSYRAAAKPNSFARGKILLSTEADAMSVPKSAIFLRDNLKVVFIVREGIAHQRTVETGFGDGDTMQVISGVEVGDAVVVSGADALQDKAKVKVIEKRDAKAALR